MPKQQSEMFSCSFVPTACEREIDRFLFDLNSTKFVAIFLLIFSAFGVVIMRSVCEVFAEFCGGQKRSVHLDIRSKFNDSILSMVSMQILCVKAMARCCKPDAQSHDNCHYHLILLVYQIAELTLTQTVNNK